MRPQPTLRAAFRSALTASRAQSCAGRPVAAVVSFPQNAVVSSRLHSKTKTAATQSFSTSTRRSSQNDQATSTSTTTSSSSSSSSTESAPVLPASVLSQILFAPSSTAPSASSPAAAVASVTSNNPSVYATVQIHGRPYLVTPGDSLRLPFKMPGVQPGDELLLNRVGVVGNRTVTAVAGSESQTNSEKFDVPFVPGASVKAVVLGVETEPLRTLVKKKRRTRRKRTVKSKHHFTVLRIQEVSVAEQ